MIKKLLIVSVLFVITSGVLFTMSQLKLRNAQQAQQQAGTTTTPDQGSLLGQNPTQTGPLFTKEAVELQAKIQNSVESGVVKTEPSLVLPDSQIIDRYPAGDSISQIPDYQTEYFAETNEFRILLFRFPLQDTRARAQKYFIQKLNVTEAEACLLRVTVMVTPDVSQSLSGKDLGMSFCPSSTDLSSYTENTDGEGNADQAPVGDVSL
jgi:hypothetical protein